MPETQRILQLLITACTQADRWLLADVVTTHRQSSLASIWGWNATLKICVICVNCQLCCLLVKPFLRKHDRTLFYGVPTTQTHRVKYYVSRNLWVGIYDGVHSLLDLTPKWLKQCTRSHSFPTHPINEKKNGGRINKCFFFIQEKLSQLNSINGKAAEQQCYHS